MPDEHDVAYASAVSLLDLYLTKMLSPVEATRLILDRLDALQPKINAFCIGDRDGALAAARASEERWLRSEAVGRLDGVPVTIKDLILMRGFPTLRGSRLVERDRDWSEDAPATARLREAGAVIIGKTTTPEFGWKALGASRRSGIPRNPWDLSRTPGGSSAGAAAACAAGLGPLHVGSDGAGSIRIPSAFTGVFGLKPSFGRVPAHPPSPMGLLAHIGPMARTVADTALLLTVLSGPDHRDPYALPPEDTDYAAGLEEGVRGWRIAYRPSLPVGQDLNDPTTERNWIAWSPFSYPFNLTRQPAASIPCGLTRAGLPIGLQIVGPLYADHRVLRAARAFEMTQSEQRAPLEP